MKVTFEWRTDLGNPHCETWNLVAVPRAGESVQLREGLMEVREVYWVLYDDDGKVIEPYAQVRLKVLP